MAKGWHRESRRHSLASRGVKTAVPKAEAMMKASRTKNDYDGDGVSNALDCEPRNPNKQGFFDGIKKGVQNVKKNQEIKTQEQYWKREKKLSDLKKQLEAKEDSLNKKKETALLKEQTQVEEKKAIAQIKLKENELNILQKELEKDTFKGNAKLFGKALGKEALTVLKEARTGKTKKTKKSSKPQLSKEKIALTNTKKEIKKLKNQEITIKRKLTILRKKIK